MQSKHTIVFISKYFNYHTFRVHFNKKLSIISQEGNKRCQRP